MSCNRSQKLKTGIIYGFIFFVLHATLNYWFLEKDISTALIGGSIFGVIMGFFNALFIIRFGVPIKILESISLELEKGEKILFQSAANFITHPVALNGKLFITNKSVVFKHHDATNEEIALCIGLHDIDKLEILKLLFIFDKGVAVHTLSKQEYQFTIDSMKQLKLFIRDSNQISSFSSSN